MVGVRQIMNDEGEFLEAANVSDLERGAMRSVELKGIYILIANVDGQFYALDDRCGHMNAMLSMGNLNGKIVTCPFHYAQFDVTTGQKVKEPMAESFKDMDKLPEEMQKFMIYAKKLMDPVKTYDMQTHEIKVEGNKILVRI
ncbi:MAG: Rieske 2Fe-2S domain-containing protein [Candidatus Bathyarchaeia archaeon]